MEKKRIHVFYSGMVQGVGFRFTTERVASSLGLCGWVRNTLDGRVEVVCEGREEAVVEFLKRIKTGPMKNYIMGTDVTWLGATGEFKDFSVGV